MGKLIHRPSLKPVNDKVRSLSRIMKLVCAALCPAFLFGIYNFGIQVLVITFVTMISCLAAEYIFNLITKRKQTVNDFSAVVTGMLLALTMPVGVEIWEPVLGGIFAIVVVKGLFGGYRKNILNPALTARCLMMIVFAADMSDYTCDAYTGATPLGLIANAGNITGLVSGDTDIQNSYSVMNMFMGNTAGAIGETSVAAILIGAVILLAFGVINLRIPAAYLLSFSVFMFFLGSDSFSVPYVIAELCGGGLMLGAFFMATDPSTSPKTPALQIAFGISCGLLTGLFRCIGPNAEGVAPAIVISNLLFFLIRKVSQKRNKL